MMNFARMACIKTENIQYEKLKIIRSDQVYLRAKLHAEEAGKETKQDRIVCMVNNYREL